MDIVLQYDELLVIRMKNILRKENLLLLFLLVTFTLKLLFPGTNETPTIKFDLDYILMLIAGMIINKVESKKISKPIYFWLTLVIFLVFTVISNIGTFIKVSDTNLFYVSTTCGLSLVFLLLNFLSFWCNNPIFIEGFITEMKGYSIVYKVIAIIYLLILLFNSWASVEAIRIILSK